MRSECSLMPRRLRDCIASGFGFEHGISALVQPGVYPGGCERCNGSRYISTRYFDFVSFSWRQQTRHVACMTGNWNGVLTFLHPTGCEKGSPGRSMGEVERTRSRRGFQLVIEPGIGYLHVPSIAPSSVYGPISIKTEQGTKGITTGTFGFPCRYNMGGLNVVNARGGGLE